MVERQVAPAGAKPKDRAPERLRLLLPVIHLVDALVKSIFSVGEFCLVGLPLQPPSDVKLCRAGSLMSIQYSTPSGGYMTAAPWHAGASPLEGERADCRHLSRGLSPLALCRREAGRRNVDPRQHP